MNPSYNDIVENTPLRSASEPQKPHEQPSPGQEQEAATDLYEAGFDVLTHGGGQLESVQDFCALGTLVEGLGSDADVPLPEAYDTMASAGKVEFNDYSESVCGADDRMQVNSVANVPWRMIAQLVITLANGSKVRGTGWFVSPRTLITAGHCVFSHRNGGWARSIEVVPGMNGRKRPFGTAVSTRFKSVKGWTENQEVSYDYGCLLLPEDARLGDKTGWFGFAKLSDASLESLLANNSGYPGDKAFGTQWFNAGRITKATPSRLHYMLDTAPGQSGSPAWKFSNQSDRSGQSARTVIGIHNYGGCANKATRINQAVFDNLMTWKREGA